MLLISAICHIIIGTILLLHVFNIINAKALLIGGAAISILYGFIGIHRYVRNKNNAESHNKED